jgi:hypothetical protein
MLDIRFPESFFKIITGAPKNSISRRTKVRKAAITHTNNLSDDLLIRHLLSGITARLIWTTGGSLKSNHLFYPRILAASKGLINRETSEMFDSTSELEVSMTEPPSSTVNLRNSLAQLRISSVISSG